MGIENKDRLVRYWLGVLPLAEKVGLEKECQADDRLSEALKEAENDLLDSYVCGELPEEQRMQFEQNYLDSPEKREQVEVARLLINPAVRQRIAATAIPVPQEPCSWWQSWLSFSQTGHLTVKLATLTAGIVVAALVVFLILQNHRLRSELARLEAEQTKLHQQIAELQRNSNVPGIGSGQENVTVSALLKPGLRRQGGSPSGNPPLTVPPSASSVLLLLALSSDLYPQYNVVVETPEGNIVHRALGLSSKSARGGRIIEVPLPAQAIPNGDYIVTLSGAKPNKRSQIVDSYAFSVSQ